MVTRVRPTVGLMLHTNLNTNLNHKPPNLIVETAAMLAFSNGIAERGAVLATADDSAT